MLEESHYRRPEIILIGGQIASGKSAVAVGLGSMGDATVVRVRTALENILGGAEWDRRRLQTEGADLDRRTNGRWLLEYLQSLSHPAPRLIVDAARTRRQIEPILNEETDSRLIYLAASESTRRRRFALSRVHDAVKRSMSFDDAMHHETESEAVTLAAMAHLVVETDGVSLASTCDEILTFLARHA